MSEHQSGHRNRPGRSPPNKRTTPARRGTAKSAGARLASLVVLFGALVEAVLITDGVGAITSWGWMLIPLLFANLYYIIRRDRRIIVTEAKNLFGMVGAELHILTRDRRRTGAAILGLFVYMAACSEIASERAIDLRFPVFGNSQFQMFSPKLSGEAETFQLRTKIASPTNPSQNQSRTKITRNSRKSSSDDLRVPAYGPAPPLFPTCLPPFLFFMGPAELAACDGIPFGPPTSSADAIH